MANNTTPKNSPPLKEVTEKMDTLQVETPKVSDDEPYAILMETNGKECESWYYFIRYKGNEENLRHLKKQFDQVDWYIVDDASTFDVVIEPLVDAKTAKQMSKIELNSVMFHRKYDGVLERIDLHFSSRDSNETKIYKANDILSYGQIEEYIDAEDIDPEDQISETDEMSDSEESPSPSPPRKQTAKKGVPPALLNSELPRFARRKRKNNRN